MNFFFKKNTCFVFALVVVVVVVSPPLLGRSNSRKKEGPQLKGSVHHGRKSWRKSLERTGHVASAFRKQTDGSWGLAHFLPQMQFSF